MARSRECDFCCGPDPFMRAMLMHDVPPTLPHPGVLCPCMSMHTLNGHMCVTSPVAIWESLGALHIALPGRMVLLLSRGYWSGEYCVILSDTEP